MRIVVVDDEQSIAHTLSLVLRTQGYAVTWFVSPRLALIHVKAAQPDLVISDVMMDEMDGVDLALRIKDSTPACKVILFSALPDEPRFCERLAPHPELRILSKPLSINELLGHVEVATDLEHRQPPKPLH